MAGGGARFGLFSAAKTQAHRIGFRAATGRSQKPVIPRRTHTAERRQMHGKNYMLNSAFGAFTREKKPPLNGAHFKFLSPIPTPIPTSKNTTINRQKTAL
jgi:hypothetical protein